MTLALLQKTVIQIPLFLERTEPSTAFFFNDNIIVQVSA